MKVHHWGTYIIWLIFIILIDLYIYFRLKSQKRAQLRHLALFHIIVSIPVIASFLLYFFNRYRLFSIKELTLITQISGYFVIIYLPKLVYIFLHLTGRLTKHLIKFTVQRTNSIFSTTIAFRFNRKSHFSFIISLVIFSVLLWGMMYGISNFKIIKTEIVSSKVPNGFDKFKIIQLSDIHLGNWMPRPEEVEKIVKMINVQNPDLVVFTGDLVNSYADEAEPFISIFKKIKANYPVYAVLGNHDYSSYNKWEKIQDKIRDHQKLLVHIQQMGMKLLNNEAVVLHKNGDSLALIGVENWGHPPFPQLGDYEKAVASLKNVPLKILLSHDPDHWGTKILNKQDVLLTLSGHTHGGQIGLEIGKLKISPVQKRYKFWAGLYSRNGQYLYVNRGTGFLGFPIRLGMPPEITLIELKAKD